jgi:serine/threonine protein kinase
MTDADLLLDALTRWHDGRAVGVPPSPVDLLPDRADLHVELARQIERVRLVEGEMEESNPESIEPVQDDTPDEAGSKVLKRVLDMLDPPGEPDEMKRAGDYGILSILGHGGMGVVLRARHRATRDEVALKMIVPSGRTPSLRSVRRFRRESRIATSLVHPHICPVLGTGDFRGLPYLLMPLLSGQSLRDRQRAVGRCGIDELAAIAVACTDGLAYLHERNVVHRDIKPSNLWLEPGGPSSIRIIDFGLAKQFERESHELDGSLTRQEDGPLGTPEYAAPEQLRSEPVDGRADFFSLGVVLYQLATGLSPFKAARHYETGMNVLSKTPPSLASLRPDFPEELVTAIEALLVKDRDQRPDAKTFRSKFLRPLRRVVSLPGSGETLPFGPPRVGHHAGERVRSNLALTRLRTSSPVEIWAGVADGTDPVRVAFVRAAETPLPASIRSWETLSHPRIGLRTSLCGVIGQQDHTVAPARRAELADGAGHETVLVERDLPTRLRHALDERPDGWSAEDVHRRFEPLAEAIDLLHRPIHPTANGPRAFAHGRLSEETIAVTTEGLVLCDLIEMLLAAADADPRDDRADFARLYSQVRMGRRGDDRKPEWARSMEACLTPAELAAVERATHADPALRFPDCRSFIRAVSERPSAPPKSKSSQGLLKRFAGWLPFGSSSPVVTPVVPRGTKPDPLTTIDHAATSDLRLTAFSIRIRDASRAIVGNDLIRNGWYTPRPDHVFQVEPRLTAEGYAAVFRYDGISLSVVHDVPPRAMTVSESRVIPFAGWQGPNLLVAVATPEPIASAAGLLLANDEPIVIPRWRSGSIKEIGLVDFPTERTSDPRIAPLAAAFGAIDSWFRGIPCVVDVRGLGLAVGK